MKKSTAFSIITIFALIAAVLIVYFGFLKKQPSFKPPEPLGDLQTHPIYSHYKFNNSDNILNIGVQPLYLPTGIILEAIKRDRILLQNLHDLGMDIQFFSFLKGNV